MFAIFKKFKLAQPQFELQWARTSHQSLSEVGTYKHRLTDCRLGRPAHYPKGSTPKYSQSTGQDVNNEKLA